MSQIESKPGYKFTIIVFEDNVTRDQIGEVLSKAFGTVVVTEED